eukprot:3256251-Rhodomonas_salina.1
MLTGVSRQCCVVANRNKAKSRKRSRVLMLSAHWCLTPVLRGCRSKQRRNPEKSPSLAVAECSLVSHASAA